jgi:ribonuclease BN (tRNA processing enzyme)
VAADVRVTEIGEGEFPLPGFRACAFRLRHPGTTYGYRLGPAKGTREIAYLTDNELGDGGNYPVGDGWRGELVEFLSGADTLIHDAMYSETIIQARSGWGHSTPKQAVDLAAEAGCRHLVLFHHEPEHDDDAVDRLLEETRGYGKRVAPALRIDAAAEGAELPL